MFPFPKIAFLLTAACGAFLSADARAQSIDVYISAPGVATAEGSGIGLGGQTIETETFESLAAGPFTSGYASANLNAIYTDAGGVTIKPNSASYGGYQQGNYASITGGSALTLALNNPVQYIGFDFYAGDSQNSFQVYDGNTLIATYSTAALISLLPNNSTATVTDVAGDTVHTSLYYGQQFVNSSGNTVTTNPGQPYAYIDLVAQGAQQITSIVFKQGGQSGGAAFETDNDSTLTTAPTGSQIPGTFVLVGVVPEPSTWAVIGVGTMGLLGWQARRRARQARGAR